MFEEEDRKYDLEQAGMEYDMCRKRIRELEEVYPELKKRNKQRNKKKPIEYVRHYKSSKHAKKGLDGLKDIFIYYMNKRKMLKKELKEKGLWNDMPQNYRYEMYALRTMLGILQVKITKCTIAYKKLQREESIERRMKEIEEMEDERGNRL